MKTHSYSRLVTLIVFTILSAGLFAAVPKYVFLFIGDGMSTPQRMIAEEFSVKTGNGPLLINHLSHHATTRTCSASSLVTDSAAAATAIACGEKTNNGSLGVGPAGERLESVAEVAHAAGRKVGIVTSVTICHATPGGFYAHRKSRGRYYQIGLDLIASDFDYFAGGGLDNKFDDRKDPLYKGNLYDLAAKAGYHVVTNRTDLESLKSDCGKVFYRAREGALPFDIDKSEKGEDLPSLADLTRKGIECLDHPAGFFMMVEGGRIDWAGHANDAAANLREVLAFDRAVRVAKAFQDAHPNEVLIIVTGDHETGGMAMGFAGTGYAIYTENLGHQKCSCEAFRSILKKARKTARQEKKPFTFEEAKPLLTQWFGFVFDLSGKAPDIAADGDKYAKKHTSKADPMIVSQEEYKVLEEGFNKGDLPGAARRVISAKAGIGWSSGAHTALPVLTTSQGPRAEDFTGFLDNTDLSKKIKALYR